MLSAFPVTVLSLNCILLVVILLCWWYI